MAADSLIHQVPRLHSPDVLWIVPVPQAKWMLLGLFSGPMAAQVVAWLHLAPSLEGAWRVAWVYVIWAIGLVVGLLGAFFRPGGLHIGAWLNAWLIYHLRPHRAIWRP